MQNEKTISTPSAAEAKLAESKGRRGQRKGIAESGTATESAPITEAATLGMAEPFVIGTPQKPLLIHMRAPVIIDGKALYGRILRDVPDVLLGAAVSDPFGKGLDLDAVVGFWNENQMVKDPVTTREIELELGAFTEALFSYDPKIITPSDNHVLDQISDIVWALAGGWNEGLTREDLPMLLLSHHDPASFADLIRAIFRTCRGCNTTYESDIVSRFTQP